ncbi:PRTase-like protein [Xylona heveae TC161]|uniref:uracil phosphoribosyltransferase n=1 Tax=Xylona heveae (strain CBS 132557 / TC161) TaxID=1328760 RepID=A0A165JQS5_XYLHT|nr:PRTase-like protein [Xylona heveae TC161]KZF26521.1 PRTase-like protein [Xylona heveae TC161]
MTSLPSNVRVSTHPCLKAKISQLRSSSSHARVVNALVHEISTILACEALASGLTTKPGDTDTTPLGYTYTTDGISPTHISLVPILRSGLSMVEAFQTLLPHSVPVHHLGLFREPSTLQPVEYYNNLPYHRPSSTGAETSAASDLAILLDPVIATGGTASAAIQTLREWGVKKVILVSVVASAAGVAHAAEEWTDGVQVLVGSVDGECDEQGMIKPGLGDVGDRLFLTIGK